MLLSSRHPEEPRSGVSKDARPGWWPSTLRDARPALLRATEKSSVLAIGVGDKLSLAAEGTKISFVQTGRKSIAA